MGCQEAWTGHLQPTSNYTSLAIMVYVYAYQTSRHMTCPNRSPFMMLRWKPSRFWQNLQCTSYPLWPWRMSHLHIEICFATILIIKTLRVDYKSWPNGMFLALPMLSIINLNGRKELCSGPITSFIIGCNLNWRVFGDFISIPCKLM